MKLGALSCMYVPVVGKEGLTRFAFKPMPFLGCGVVVARVRGRPNTKVSSFSGSSAG